MDDSVGTGAETSGGMQFPLTVPQTLMKYDPPIFAGLQPSSDSGTHNNSNNNGGGTGVVGGQLGRGNKGQGGNAQGKTSQLDDMVNSMLPPREWTEETLSLIHI